MGGRTLTQATSFLERRFERVADRPITFVAGRASFRFTASQLGVDPGWRAAVDAAAHEGGGFGPVRGFRRLHTRVFGADVLPRVGVSSKALEFALDEISDAVDVSPVGAALARRGLRIEMHRERVGARLDRGAAGRAIVRALASIGRERPTRVELEVETAEPRVTAADLVPVAQHARLALSAPVFLRGGSRGWRLPRWRLARLLQLPHAGSTNLAIAGPEAESFFRRLARRVDRAPVDAGFDVSNGSVRVVPARHGVELDVATTARRLLRAATSSARRTARLRVVRSAPAITTTEAGAMGITQEMSSFKTYYSGTADRITNLRLGVEALDGTLVAPGETFSLNAAIGERTAERGFRPAPVIVGTKYTEEIGGGTSQVATTVFNAAWEAGVRITERNPHALYISRYPTGRDATVYWPSLDLKFQNDTSDWILVKGFAEGDGIRVSLYGGEERRVESSSGSFQVTGPVPRKLVKDRTLPRGERLVEEEGAPPSTTSVTRTIHAVDGSVLRSETWNTTYKAQPRVVRVGTKPKKPVRPKEPAKNPKPPREGATSGLRP